MEAPVPAHPSTLNNSVQSLAGDWTHIFNPGLLNDLRAGYIRFKDATLPLDFGTNAGNNVGIPMRTMAAILPA